MPRSGIPVGSAANFVGVIATSAWNFGSRLSKNCRNSECIRRLSVGLTICGYAANAPARCVRAANATSTARVCQQQPRVELNPPAADSTASSSHVHATQRLRKIGARVEREQCTDLEVPRRDVERLRDTGPLFEIAEPRPAGDAVVDDE